MSFMKRLCWLIFLLIPLFSFSQSYEQRSFYAQSLEGKPPVVDGHLNDQAWEDAVWENRFVMHEPIEGAEPSQQSFFAVLYDQHNMYVGMKLLDTSPDSIVRRMTRRDMIDGDVAGIAFDSYNDKRTAFTFSVTAAGVKNDSQMSEDGWIDDNTWNPIWWAAVSQDSLGWYVEMRIPLTQLRFRGSGNNEQEWGFQATRVLFRKQEVSVWQPVSRKQPTYVSQFGRIKGLKNIESRKIADITPYVVASTERFAKEAGNPFREKGHLEKLNAGVDAKLGVTNYLTLDLTINPDFGQVEADPSEVNLSTFETFFKEQRPFFIEGKNILQYDLGMGGFDMATEGLFYSRRIGRHPAYLPDFESGIYTSVPEFTRILGAAKLTGKTAKGLSVGLLGSVTAKEFAHRQNETTKSSISVEPFTTFAVARLQKDFNQGNTLLGGILTSVNRKLDDEHLKFQHKTALSGGIDFIHKWKDKTWELDINLYGSRVSGSPEAITRTQRGWTHLFQRPDADYLGVDSLKTSLLGNGGKISLSEFGGNVRFSGAISWKSPGLELNDIGYLRETDLITQSFWVGYQTFEPFSIFRSLNVDLSQWINLNYGGELTFPGASLNIMGQFTNYWSMMSNMTFNTKSLSSGTLRGGPAMNLPGTFNWMYFVSTNDQKKLSFTLLGHVNESFGQNHSDGYSGGLEIKWKPVNALTFAVSPSYTFHYSELQYVTTHQLPGATRYIFGSINRNTMNASLRININLTPDLSIQYWGQPFVSSGKYSKFKYITDSRAGHYRDRFREYNTAEISYYPELKLYQIRETSPDNIYFFPDPDFNFREFLSNMVLRWEYFPGSALYLVWSQNRNSFAQDGSFEVGRDLDQLWGTTPNNILLIKLSYRLGR